MANTNSYVNPNAKAGLEKMKYEVASDIGVKKYFYFFIYFISYFFTSIYLLLKTY